RGGNATRVLLCNVDGSVPLSEPGWVTQCMVRPCVARGPLRVGGHAAAGPANIDPNVAAIGPADRLPCLHKRRQPSLSQRNDQHTESARRPAASLAAARAPRAATTPRRRRLQPAIPVVRCSLPCAPPVGGHSCNGR